MRVQSPALCETHNTMLDPKLRTKTKMKLRMIIAGVLLTIGGLWTVLALQHRAIALQPIDYIKAVVTEIRFAKTNREAWLMVKGVTLQFAQSYEVRMHDGRVFSSLALFGAKIDDETVTASTNDDVHVVIR